MAELKPMIVTTVELTSKEYAAIHLCVPMSGNDELDAMIKRAQRERLAGQITVGVMSDHETFRFTSDETIGQMALAIADAVIAAGEGSHER